MKNFFLITLILSLFSTYAQNTAVPFGMEKKGIYSCGTTSYMQSLHQRYHQLPDEAAFESWLEKKVEQQRRSGNSSRRILTIPIIFHIVHNGEAIGVGDNLSPARIHSQMDVLKEDFRKMPGTPGYNNHPSGADTEIEFCLALVGPDGIPLAEPGIDRIDHIARGLSTTFGRHEDVDRKIKQHTFWDPEKYFNVWVVDISAMRIGGYAQFPEFLWLPGNLNDTLAYADGVVVDTEVVGRGAGLPYTTGRILTHEIGHWLSLRHIWGDGGCWRDDYCSDTPGSDAPNYTCDTLHVSCETVDMVRNYMDYSPDACQNIFTECQKSRMITILQHAPRRQSLLSSPACTLPTGIPVAGFRIKDNDPCTGVVSFEDSSQNVPYNWVWSFGDGTTSSLANPKHKYTQSGTYTVRLIVNNMFGTHVYSRQIQVDLKPSASWKLPPQQSRACQFSEVELKTDFPLTGATYQWEPTQNLSDPTSPNPIFKSDKASHWFYYKVTIQDSLGCEVKDSIRIFSWNIFQVSAGNDTIIDLGAQVHLAGSAMWNATSWEWSPQYQLLTSPTASFIYAAPKQTVTYILKGVNDLGCISRDSVTVYVRGTNPLSLDHNLAQQWGEILTPFPNPAEQEITFQAIFNHPGKLSIDLYDLRGRLIQRVFEGQNSPGKFATNWHRNDKISTGIYFVTWQFEGRRVTQKIQLK